jgi:hypothetical protein
MKGQLQSLPLPHNSEGRSLPVILLIKMNEFVVVACLPARLLIALPPNQSRMNDQTPQDLRHLYSLSPSELSWTCSSPGSKESSLVSLLYSLSK